MNYKSSLTLEERTSSLFHSDPAATGEYFATFRRYSQLQPEKELMLAVLEDAVACIQKYAKSSDPKERRLFHDTRNWLLTEDDDWLFSFTSVCENLGLNPGSVRRSVARMERQCGISEKSAAAHCYRTKRKDRSKRVRPAA